MTDFQTQVKDIRKALSFRDDMTQLVLDGQKSQTRRMKPKKFSVGDLVYIKTGMYMFKIDSPAILRVKDMREELLHDITHPDAQAEGFVCIDNFLQVFYEINHLAVWECQRIGQDFNPLVYVVEFELVAKNPDWSASDAK